MVRRRGGVRWVQEDGIVPEERVQRLGEGCKRVLVKVASLDSGLADFLWLICINLSRLRPKKAKWLD